MWLIGEARRGRSRAGHSGRRQREQGSAPIREPSGSVLLSGQSPSGICFPLRIGDIDRPSKGQSSHIYATSDRLSYVCPLLGAVQPLEATWPCLTTAGPFHLAGPKGHLSSAQ